MRVAKASRSLAMWNLAMRRHSLEIRCKGKVEYIKQRRMHEILFRCSCNNTGYPRHRMGDARVCHLRDEVIHDEIPIQTKSI